MRKKIIFKFLSDPSNRGRHLIFVAGKVFKAKTGREARQILAQIHKEYPRKKITLTYVPKADTLILLV
jgi:hypothetical protein